MKTTHAATVGWNSDGTTPRMTLLSVGHNAHVAMAKAHRIAADLIDALCHDDESTYMYPEIRMVDTQNLRGTDLVRATIHIFVETDGRSADGICRAMNALARRVE